MEEKTLKGRLQGISQAVDDNMFIKLRDAALKTGAVFIRPPETGLLMMELKDTFNTGFYLGEVLVTEAAAEFNGMQGYAMAIGDCPVVTGALACVEAIEKNNGAYKNDAAEIIKELEALESAAEEITKKENAFVSSTRVNFESMRKG